MQKTDVRTSHVYSRRMLSAHFNGLDRGVVSTCRFIAMPLVVPWRKPFLSASSVYTRRTRLMSRTANPLPATFLRGGTSKGVFIKRSDLPHDPQEWSPILQGIMGSPDPQYRRQLNGMGGGVSSLSKVCVIGPPSSPDSDIDVEYTFVQIGVDDGALDFSGNCGNLSSVVGVFALDEGLCAPRTVEGSPWLAKVRFLNTNTSKVIETTFPISRSGLAELERPEIETAGVPGKASRIVLQFVNPGGARTGKLLPTGFPLDNLSVQLADGVALDIPVSLVDATNPTVFVAAESLLPALGFDRDTPISLDLLSTPDAEDTIERIRKVGAVRMGLDPSQKAQPKIAILSAPETSAKDDVGVDVVIHAFSMGVAHKAVPMTVGLCLGVASGVSGTIAADIVTRARTARGAVVGVGMTKIWHPGGVVEVGAQFAQDGTVLNAQVARTGRRLMKGAVWW